jgi:hypothetical protein
MVPVGLGVATRGFPFFLAHRGVSTQLSVRGDPLFLCSTVLTPVERYITYETRYRFVFHISFFLVGV